MIGFFDRRHRPSKTLAALVALRALYERGPDIAGERRPWRDDRSPVTNRESSRRNDQ